MIELLEELEQLAGKTIKSAKLIDCSETLFIEFTDETGAVFMATSDQEVYIENDISEYIKREAGIISEVEYDLEVKRTQEKLKIVDEERERAQLAMLQKKYRID